MSAPVLGHGARPTRGGAARAATAFTPDWRPLPGGPGDALLEIYAQFLRALGERIDAAPDKNELAFLDLLGLDVLPAQAARAAVVFATIPGGGDGRAPAGTRLARRASTRPFSSSSRPSARSVSRSHGSPRSSRSCPRATPTRITARTRSAGGRSRSGTTSSPSRMSSTSRPTATSRSRESPRSRSTSISHRAGRRRSTSSGRGGTATGGARSRRCTRGRPRVEHRRNDRPHSQRHDPARDRLRREPAARRRRLEGALAARADDEAAAARPVPSARAGRPHLAADGDRPAAAERELQRRPAAGHGVRRRREARRDEGVLPARTRTEPGRRLLRRLRGRVRAAGRAGRDLHRASGDRAGEGRR